MTHIYTPQERTLCEKISDKIRRGEPVGVFDALVAIDYQAQLQVERKEAQSKMFVGKAQAFVRNLFKIGGSV
jgi:hypothetical protein